MESRVKMKLSWGVAILVLNLILSSDCLTVWRLNGARVGIELATNERGN